MIRSCSWEGGNRKNVNVVKLYEMALRQKSANEKRDNFYDWGVEKFQYP